MSALKDLQAAGRVGLKILFGDPEGALDEFRKPADEPAPETKPEPKPGDPPCGRDFEGYTCTGHAEDGNCIMVATKK